MKLCVLFYILLEGSLINFVDGNGELLTDIFVSVWFSICFSRGNTVLLSLCDVGWVTKQIQRR